jgi:hypothetical protein
MPLVGKARSPKVAHLRQPRPSAFQDNDNEKIHKPPRTLALAFSLHVRPYGLTV